MRALANSVWFVDLAAKGADISKYLLENLFASPQALDHGLASPKAFAYLSEGGGAAATVGKFAVLIQALE